MAALEPVTSGQIWKPTAEEINAYREAVRGGTGSPSATPPPFHSARALRTRAINGTGGAVSPNGVGVVNPDAGFLDPQQDFDAFLRDQVLQVVSPESNKRVVIFERGAAAGDPASVVLLGATVALIDITDTNHGSAQVINGDSVKLTSSSSGAIEILQKPTTSTGEQWCLVLLGGGPATHDTLTGTLTTATVANQTWANVTPAAGYRSLGSTVRVKLADNASARPVGDPVIAHRFKDVQSLANPPAVAVDVQWDETPAGEGGLTYRVELAADLAKSDTTASVWRLITGTNARQDNGGDPASLSPAFNVGNSLGLTGYGADNTTDLNPTPSESEARGTFGVIQEVTDPATGSASFELVELMGVVPFEQIAAGEEYSTTATFEGAYPQGDNRDNPPPSQLGGDYTTENMATITEKNLDGLTVWWKDTPERVRLFERPLVPCEFVNNLFTGSKGSTTTLRPLDSAGAVLSDGATDALDFAAQVLTDDQYGLAGWKCWACKSRQTNKWSLVWHERYVQRVAGPMNLGGGTLNVASVQGVGEHTPSNPVSYSDPTGLASDLKNGDTLLIGFTGFTSGSGPRYTVVHCDDGKTKVSKDDTRQFLKDQFTPLWSGGDPSSTEPDLDNDTLRKVEFRPVPEGGSPTSIEAYVWVPDPQQDEVEIPGVSGCLGYNAATNTYFDTITAGGIAQKIGCTIFVPPIQFTNNDGSDCLTFTDNGNNQIDFELDEDCLAGKLSERICELLGESLTIQLNKVGDTLEVKLLCDGNDLSSDSVPTVDSGNGCPE